MTIGMGFCGVNHFVLSNPTVSGEHRRVESVELVLQWPNGFFYTLPLPRCMVAPPSAPALAQELLRSEEEERDEGSEGGERSEGNERSERIEESDGREGREGEGSQGSEGNKGREESEGSE